MHSWLGRTAHGNDFLVLTKRHRTNFSSRFKQEQQCHDQFVFSRSNNSSFVTTFTCVPSFSSRLTALYGPLITLSSLVNPETISICWLSWIPVFTTFILTLFSLSTTNTTSCIDFFASPASVVAGFSSFGGPYDLFAFSAMATVSRVVTAWIGKVIAPFTLRVRISTEADIPGRNGE